MASLLGPTKLEMLAEQTAFLLEKQKEMKHYYEKEYADFLRVLDATLLGAQSKNNTQEVEDLQFIRHVIDQQGQQLIGEVQDDVVFLTNQLNGIAQVRALNDTRKEKEFEQMLLEGEQDILPTDQFKQEVMAEVKASRHSLTSMFDDFKNTLREGGGHSLALLLEAMAQEQEQGEADDEGQTSCCGSKELDETGECCGEGFDILGFTPEDDPSQEIKIKDESSVSCASKSRMCGGGKGGCGGNCTCGKGGCSDSQQQGCSCGKKCSCKAECDCGEEGRCGKSCNDCNDDVRCSCNKKCCP